MITYYLENRNGDQLAIGSNLNPRRDPLQFKPEKQEYMKQGQFGVVTRGTFKQASKNIDLKFNIIPSDVTDYYFKLNSIASFLYNQQNAPFYLYSIQRGVRAKVSISGIKENFKEGLETKLGIDCTLSLTMEDALWESAEVIPGSNDLFNGGNFDIELGSDVVDSAAIFTLTNLDAANNVQFGLQLTNGSIIQNVVISPTGFSTGSVIVFDCFNGTIKLNDQFIPNSIIAGGFFPLLPGTNNILYESPANQEMTIATSYRSRRPF